MSLPQGTNPFLSGLTAQMQDSSSCWFQKKLGGFLCSGWVVSYRIATGCPEKGTQSGTGGDAEQSKSGEKHSASETEHEVPHCVCSALTALGEVQGGEVNIVRGGGASLGGQPSHASHRQGPSQLSPSGMLKKPRSRACPGPPQHHLPPRGLNQPALTPKPQGSHPSSHTVTSHPLLGLLRHAGVLDAELEATVLQTGLRAVGGGVTAAHTFTVAA